MSRFVWSILVSILVSGCASLNSVSVTSIPADRNNAVSAAADRWIIFGFNFDNDYADQVAKDLEGKCAGGKISGILTKDETYNYFLFLVMKKHVEATGYCSKGAIASNRKSKTRQVNSVEESEVPEDEGSNQ